MLRRDGQSLIRCAVPVSNFENLIEGAKAECVKGLLALPTDDPLKLALAHVELAGRFKGLEAARKLFRQAARLDDEQADAL